MLNLHVKWNKYPGVNQWKHQGRNSLSSWSRQNIIWLCRITIPIRYKPRGAQESHLTWSLPLSILLPYCVARGYLDMVDNAFLFWALPLLEGTRMTAACDDAGATAASFYKLYLLYKTRGNNLELWHLISINLNCQETPASQKVLENTFLCHGDVAH